MLNHGNGLQDVDKRIATCQQQMADLKSQLNTVARRKADIVAQLDKSVDESHPHREALVAIFNKKIKRAPTRGPSGRDDEDSDEDRESDDDEDSEDDEGTPDVCPPGCDQALYDEARPLLCARLPPSCLVALLSMLLLVWSSQERAVRHAQSNCPSVYP